MEDEEFVALLKEEYELNGLPGLENIIVEDSVSNCSFRDLMEVN
jgi:hypothetical protein